MPIKLQVIGGDALVKIGALTAQRRENLMLDFVDAAATFGNDAVAIAKKEYLRGPRPEKIQSSGLLKARINTTTERAGNVIKTKVGSDLVYARIQEYGGTTHPSVTDRMRKFAWFMFFKTNDDKWKRLALTNKSTLTIKIPARPYLRPAIKDAMPSFRDNIFRILKKLSFSGA